MIYLFYGSDEYARSVALHAMKARIPEDLADLNIASFDGKRLKPEDLRTACEAMPFLAEARLVIAYDAIKHARSADARDKLRELLPNVPQWTDLVFVEREEPDSRTTLAKDLKKFAKVQIFSPREGAELLAWMQSHASKELGVKLAPPAAQALADAIGNDGWTVANELAKLAAYVGPGGTITPAEVRLLVADEVESNIFTFVDTLFGRPGPATLQQSLTKVHELLADGQAPHYLLFMIARQLRLMLAAQSAGRASPDDLARTLGQRPFVIRKALDQARNFQPARLRHFHDLLTELDHGLKTGRVDPEVALDLLIGEVALPA